MTEISMSYHGVSELAHDVNRAADAIYNELENLQSRVTKSTADWSGDAKEAYAKVQRDWDRKAGDLRDHLKRIAAEVGSAPDSYRATDRKIAGTFQI